MRNVLFSIPIICSAAILCCAQETSPHLPTGRILPSVSLMQLIVTPEKYDKKVVVVKGYVSLEFEDYGLYFSRDDYEHLTGSNGVWLDFEPGVLKDKTQIKELQGRYVLVEGVFDAKSFGHMGSFAGTLRRITRIQVSLNRADLQRMLRNPYQ
ncbi:MAG: hypothetical protein ACR2IF_02800 [Terriglobales bacterium]